MPGIMICAYRPSEKLLKVVGELLSARSELDGILIVDDGSGKDFDPIFTKLASDPFVQLLRLQSNQGKGGALKAGLRHVLEKVGWAYVVCADADGQHAPADIVQVCRRTQSPGELVLGSRDFSGSVPFRNAFGNRAASLTVKALFGIGLRDTQSGLRGFASAMIPAFLEIANTRFDFEMRQLIFCIKNGVRIVEVPIQTIYPRDKDSHFGAIRDSAGIYKVIFSEYFAKRGAA